MAEAEEDAELVLHVFDNVTGSGNNTKFCITGFVTFVPIGRVSTKCALGNVTCDNGRGLYQLAE